LAILDRLREMFGGESHAERSDTAPPVQLPTRLLQIGLDFGTCWSKMVIRDYEVAKPLAFGVRPSGIHKGPENTYRIPSAVTLYKDHFFFGWPGHAKTNLPDAVTYH
jgi:hypothetical protein